MLYLSNYTTIQLKDAIARLEGVGDLLIMGQQDYSMRVWIDPDKLQSRNITVGVAISFPIHNRTAQANLAGARIQGEQLDASVRSQEQAIEMDVRNAAQAVDTAQRRVVASRLARESAEQQLAGEQKLYEVGRSTTFLLLQRQNELTTARTNELQAQTDYNKALADLQRATAATLRVNNVVVESAAKP